MKDDCSLVLFQVVSKLNMLCTLFSMEKCPENLEVNSAGMYYFLSGIVDQILSVQKVIDSDSHLINSLGLDTTQVDDGGSGFS